MNENYATWKLLCANSDDEHFDAYVTISGSKSYRLFSRNFMEKANAYLRIYQIIELGYGGNLIEGGYTIDWEMNIVWNSKLAVFGFKTRELAEKFLSYEENEELINEFYSE